MHVSNKSSVSFHNIKMYLLVKSFESKYQFYGIMVVDLLHSNSKDFATLVLEYQFLCCNLVIF